MEKSRDMEEVEEMKGFAETMNHLYYFIEPMVLKSIVQLGLPDLINGHGRAVTLPELSGGLPFDSVHKDRLQRILRYAVHMGLFTVDDAVADCEPRYGLTPASKFLLSDAGKCISPLILLMTREDVTSSFEPLSAWLVGKARMTGVELMHGRPIWELMTGKPEHNRTFNEGMAAMTRFDMSAVVRDGKEAFEGVGSLVDVGGGAGMAAAIIVKAFPHIKCTVLDRPEAVAGAQECPNVNYIPGNMFAFVPPAEAVFMKNVLHNWDDEDCIKILKQCKEAISKEGGKIIIVEIIIKESLEDMLSDLQIEMDMGMAVLAGGKERTKEEWRILLQTSAMDIINITPTSSILSIIEAYPISMSIK